MQKTFWGTAHYTHNQNNQVNSGNSSNITCEINKSPSTSNLELCDVLLKVYKKEKIYIPKISETLFFLWRKKT